MNHSNTRGKNNLSAEFWVKRPHLLKVFWFMQHKKLFMQVKKTNLQFSYIPFGHYFSVLKLGKQLVQIVFQLMAGKEDSSITSGSEQGLSQGSAMSPLWLLQGLQDLGWGSTWSCGRAAVLSVPVTHLLHGSTNHFCSIYLWWDKRINGPCISQNGRDLQGHQV